MIRHTVPTGPRVVSAILVTAISTVCSSYSLAVLRHEYLFNSGDGTQIIDSAGTAHGTVINTTIIPADSRLELNGNEQYGDLPASTIAINTFSELTLEMWLTVSTVNTDAFTAAVAFGTTVGGNGEQYIMMQPTRATNQSSAQITAAGGGTEAFVGGPQISNGMLRHIAATIDDTQISYYIDGELQGVTLLNAPGTPASLASVSTDFAYIGNSVWQFDPTLVGSIYEMRIYDDAKDATAINTLFTNGCVDACGGDLYFEIDRDTGAGRFVNDLSNRNLVIYEISSEDGALRINADGWQPIADTGLDPDDTWQILSDTRTLLSEQDPVGQGAEDGILLGSGGPISIGNVWTQSPFEDVEVTITYLDDSFVEQTASLPVRFINGINDEPFKLGDFDLDGDLDVTDYNTFMSRHQEDFAATIAAELAIDTFDLGDLDGDLDNDYADFRLFKAAYIAENGAAAFQALAGGQAVPEPSTGIVLAIGLATAGLAARRKSVLREVLDNRSQNRLSMIRSTCMLATVVIFIASVGIARAQQIVVAETFDTRLDTTPFGVEGATTLTLVDQGGGDQALQFTSTSAAGGFFAAGFTLPTFEVEPGPGGPNISGNLADYQLSMDVTINAINDFIPNLEIWLADGPRFSTNSANLYTASGLTNGTQTISFPLNQNLTTTMPNGFTNGGDPFTPEADDWWLQLNTISFGAPAGASVDYTIDNIQVTIDISDSLALIVDEVDGEARIRNISADPITFDYYSIQSSSDGALLTADYDGTTGWNSLADQQRDSLGPGVDENWREATEVNSANQLIETFLLGGTTLAPNQSVSIGAPINPALLSDPGTNPLSFRIGGDAFPALAIGQVLFETIEGLDGDFNGDGVVNLADYTTWRDNLGAASEDAIAGNGDGMNGVDVGDYNLWKANFGAASAAMISGVEAATVPEPSSVLLLTGCVSGVVFLFARRSWNTARGKHDSI